MLPIALFLSLLLGPTNYDDLLPQTLPVVEDQNRNLL